MSKLSKNQKGMAQLYVIIAVIIVLAAGGVIAWQATKKSTPTAPSNTASANTATVSSACLKAYNDSSLCAFAEHTKIANQQYVAIGTATSGTGTTSTFTVSNDGKGNTEVIYGSNGQEISSISLGGITYIQEGTGTTWLEYSSSTSGSATVAPNPTSGFDLNFNTATPVGVTVTKEGTSACGSLTCYGYKVVDVSTPTTTAYVYFDTHDYLLRHWTSNDTTTGVSVNLTFSYHSVTIAKPSPVQQITT
jgi:hypothetical protein